MFKPSNLQHFLQEQGAKPHAWLSQNFLIDGNIVRKIIKKAGICSSDHCIEVGPGPGALTEEILTQGAHVVAVEKDRKLASALHRLQTADCRLTIYEEDALTVELSKLLPPSTQKKKFISNLPYHITTPIVTRFLPLYKQIETLTFMVQKEVAARFTATPGTKSASSISLLIHLLSIPKGSFDVPPDCFYPKPSITSSVVHLELKPPPANVKIDQFEYLAKAAFQQRRKMLRTSLREHYPEASLNNAFKQAEVDPSLRPENLSLDAFLSLYYALYPSSV